MLSNVTEFRIRKIGNKNFDSEITWHVVIVLGDHYVVSEEFNSSCNKNKLLEKYNDLLEYIGVVNSTTNFETPWENSRLLTLNYY